MRGRFKFTNGSHAYHGKSNSRGMRTMSKLHRGMPDCGDVKAAFDRVARERKERKELTNAKSLC